MAKPITGRKTRAPRRSRVPASWVRNASDEFAVSRGCYVDESRAETVRLFCSKFLRVTKGPLAGRPFDLLDWQWEGVVRPFYGWRRADGRRRFTEAYIQIGKKNGKSPLEGALGTYHLVADGVEVPEIYVLAVDRYNARSVYTEVERMVRASPTLARRLKVIPSRKVIAYPAESGFLEAGSKEVLNKEGFGPSALLWDELHLHRTDSMWRMMRYSMKARPEPVNIIVTTAGTAEDVERGSICYRRYDYAKKVTAGEIRDTEVLACVHEAGEADDPADPGTWKKANPSLDITVQSEDFEKDLAEGREDPAMMAEFKQKRLNIWISSSERYIEKSDWDACAGRLDPRRILRRNRGRPFHGGLDLASVNDLAAFAALFPWPEEKGRGADVWVRCWCPEARIDLRSRRHGVNYRTWADRGFLHPTPGRTINYKLIRRFLGTFCGLHEAASIDCDPWNGSKLLGELHEDGIPVVERRQGYGSMTDPTKQFLRLVLDRKLRHGGNPVLGWAVGNLRVESDGAGNVKPSRRRSAEKIDPAVAVIDAVGGWLDGGEADGPSTYESEGVFTVGW